MTDSILLEKAKNAGFVARIIPTSGILINEEYREYCRENLCGRYDTNYSCPPGCGSILELRDKLLSMEKALVLESIHDIDGYENFEPILSAKALHNKNAFSLYQELKAAGLECFCLNYGGCTVCETCSYLDKKPCPFPDKQVGCISSYCIDVTDLAAKCEMEYGWSDTKMYLFALIAY